MHPFVGGERLGEKMQERQFYPQISQMVFGLHFLECGGHDTALTELALP